MSRVSSAGLAVALLLVAGCSGDDDTPPESSPRPLGGATPSSTPPSEPMDDDLEKPIARKLARQVAGQGLHVDHLDCPPWHGELPSDLTCRGWFDGVEGRVLVSLRRDDDGMVAFDAVLEDGVIATRRLVDELSDKGYTSVDCGSVPAYPAVVGSTITCSVTKGGVTKQVVATITDERGGVTISDL